MTATGWRAFFFLALLAAQFACPAFSILRQLDRLENGEAFKVDASVSADWRDKNAFYVNLNFPRAQYLLPIPEFEKFIADEKPKLEACGSDISKGLRLSCGGPKVWAALDKGDDGFLKVAYVGEVRTGGRRASYENRGRSYPVIFPLHSTYNIKDNSVGVDCRSVRFRVSESVRRSFEKDLKRLASLPAGERKGAAHAVIRVKGGKWAIADVVVFGRSAAEADARR